MMMRSLEHRSLGSLEHRSLGSLEHRSLGSLEHRSRGRKARLLWPAHQPPSGRRVGRRSDRCLVTPHDDLQEVNHGLAAHEHVCREWDQARLTVDTNAPPLRHRGRQPTTVRVGRVHLSHEMQARAAG